MTHLVPQDPTPLGCLKRWLCGFKVLAQQFAKRMGWAVPVQDFSGAVVKHLLHVFDGFAREPMEARARGKELAEQPIGVLIGDRKSTRLNSSHDQISYAVFCLKNKNRWIQH